MSKNRFFLIFFMFLFSSCSRIKKEFTNYETKHYTLTNSHIEGNKYRNLNGDLCEVPFLPSGLYIICEQNELPKIDYQKRREDECFYPIKDVLSIYLNEKHIMVCTKKENLRINISSPLNIITEEKSNLEKSKKIFDSKTIDNSYSNSYIQNALSLQDKRINKKYRVNFSTPIINGITKIGLYDKQFYFGETLYSYFVLDLKTDEIKFFEDKNEYEKFCKENITHSVSILESVYLYE